MRPPKTVPAATQLLERFAVVSGLVQKIEAFRGRRIALANAAADRDTQPLLAELEQISAVLEAWWTSGGSDVAVGKKSTELGGCVIGSRMSRPKLAHGFENDEKAIEALRGTRWAKRTTRISYSLDRTATLKLLQVGGKAGSDVASLGFSIEQGDRFFVERAS